jgi:apolipoprotein N-acyltransferase
LSYASYEKTATNCLLASASGLALAASFPSLNLDLLAWVAFVPLFWVIEDQPYVRVFLYAWLQGSVFAVVSLGWLIHFFRDFAGVGFVAAGACLLSLALVLSLYGAVAIVAGVRLSRSFGIPLFLAIPPVWVAAEWIRTYWPLGGMPLNLLGDAAQGRIAVIQLAELTGIYGISALIMFVNCALYEAFRRGRSVRQKRWILLGTVVSMAGVLVFGTIRINAIERSKAEGRLRVAAVQGDISQHHKWDPAYLAPSFKIYTDASEAVLSSHPQLIIWPESAATFIFETNDFYPSGMETQRTYRSRLLQLAHKIDTPILFGAPALDFDRQLTLRNRAYLVKADGQVGDYYDKVRLVPVGEYVPLHVLLGRFMHRLVETPGNIDFTSGNRQTIFHVDGTDLGVLICYESIFPDLSRKAVEAGANVLVNMTNDAAFGDTAAPHQLLAMAVFRAVENGVPLVRVGNSGISAVITPAGRVTAKTTLFTRATEVEDVPWLRSRTFYTSVGDLFAELCFALSVIALAVAFLRDFFAGQPTLEAPTPVLPKNLDSA